MTKEEFIKKLQEMDFDKVYVKSFRGSFLEPDFYMMPAYLPQDEDAHNILIIE